MLEGSIVLKMLHCIQNKVVFKILKFSQLKQVEGIIKVNINEVHMQIYYIQ